MDMLPHRLVDGFEVLCQCEAATNQDSLCLVMKHKHQLPN